MAKVRDLASLFAVVWTTIAIYGFLLRGDGWHGEPLHKGTWEVGGGVLLLFAGGLIAAIVAVVASFRAPKS